jgi:tetratricopeptide (TPR) repeat protein
MSSGVGYFAWMIPVAIALLARHRSTLAGIAVFVAALVPVLGFVTFDFQEKSTVADHYLYLAMLGVAIAVAGGIDRAPRRALPIFIAIVALLTARSILQTRVWTNSRSLFSHALSVNPDSFVAYNNLYVIAMDEQAGVEAEQHARRMLALKPDDMLSTTNLAGALAMQERFADAEKLYREAMQRWPDRVDPYIGLGLTLLDQDRPREALEAFDAAQRIAPENPQVVHFRANAQQQAIQR